MEKNIQELEELLNKIEKKLDTDIAALEILWQELYELIDDDCVDK